LTLISSFFKVFRMNSDAGTQKNAAAGPLPDLKQTLRAISQLSRWKMLKELTCGEARTIDEMATVGGCRYDNASKHLARLVRAGLIVRGRGRLYQMAKQYLPTPGQPVVDFGHCLLRLDAGE
jgi:DNA-binding MarR family transcriptional regulator